MGFAVTRINDRDDSEVWRQDVGEVGRESWWTYLRLPGVMHSRRYCNNI